MKWTHCRKINYCLVCFLIFSFIFYSTDSFSARRERKRKGLFREVKTASENIPVSAQEAVAGAARRPIKISAIQISEEIGVVKDSFKGIGNDLIVHIQDAHCNYEAQTNISKIVDTLAKNNKLKLLAVEGSEGVIDTTPFASFPDKKIKQEVADYFMKKGRITGPEYMCITGEYDFDLFGIENRDDYMVNLNAYKSTIKYREKIEEFIKNAREVMDKLKPKIFNRELLEMDSKLSQYEDQKLTFSKYCEYLVSLAEKKTIDLAEYKNLKNFAIVGKYEDDIDFKAVDKERNDMIETIKSKLSKRYISELVVKTTNFKNGKITNGEYHSYIVNLSKGKKLDIAKYENLEKYAKYMIAYENIDHEELLEEITKIEDDIKAKIFENNDQKTLDDMNKVLKTTKKFYKLEMARQDLEYFESKRDLFSFLKYSSFIENFGRKYGVTYTITKNLGSVESAFDDYVSYYDAAKKRDGILIDNTLKRMKEDNVNISLMVCGGFHTEGMMKILKEKKISFVVLAPRITKVQEDNPYEKILLGLDDPFEDLEMGEGEEEGEESFEDLGAPVALD